MSFVFFILYQLLGILLLLMFVRAILSWIPNIDPGHPIVRALDTIVEPIVSPVRQIVPPTGGLDLSFLVAFLIIVVLRQVLLTLANTV
ncbi:MAG: YggT family protein [Chloroflexi bacterium]|nr:YggT family protein [Chloroflexota bacterium]